MSYLPKHLSPKEIAERLGLTYETVRLMCAEGKIAGAIYIGRGKKKRWRIPENSPTFQPKSDEKPAPSFSSKPFAGGSLKEFRRRMKADPTLGKRMLMEIGYNA